MCFFEYNFTASCWLFRVGDTFTDFRGQRSWENLQDARVLAAQHGCSLRQTDTRTWELVCDHTSPHWIKGKAGSRVAGGLN